MAEIAGKRRVRQLGKRAGQLDPGRAATDDQESQLPALLGLVVAILGAFEGNVLTPWLMIRVGEMNAVAVFVSLLFWGWLWGVWGLLLAVPITAAIKAVCERIDDLAPVAELLRE